MATWTDSRLKDFLRHPIGYLNGERDRAIEALNDVIPDPPKYSEELTRDLLDRKGDSLSQGEEATLAISFDFGRTLAFVRDGADIHYSAEDCFDSVYNRANEDQRQAIVAVLPPQSRLNHAVTVKDIGEFKKALRQGADVFAEVPRATAYEFRNGSKPEEDSIKLKGLEAVLVSSVAEFVEQESRIIKEHDEQGLKQGIDPDRRQFATQLADVVNPLLEEKKRMEMTPQAHSHVLVGESTQLFDAANLSPEAADIYKASLSRNVQDTNDTLDRIGGQAEPEQQAHNKQADPMDLKLDRAGEAAYQQDLRANGKAMTDSYGTKTQADTANAPLPPPPEAWVDSLRGLNSVDITADEQAASFRELLQEGAGRWNIGPNVDSAFRVALDNNTGLSQVLPVLDVLLEFGANVNISDKQGWTPLNSAIKHGNADIVSTLLAAGAKPHPIDDKHAPLDLAARRGDVEIVSLLLKAGADPNARLQAGVKAGQEREWDADWTPLHTAAEGCHDKVASLLVASGADINARTSNGDTPLHKAQEPWPYVSDSKDKFYNTVSVLVDAGADFRTPNNQGVTALDRLSRTHVDVELMVSSKRAVDLDAALPQVVQPKPPSTGEALQAAWSSTQPTKENLAAAKPAQVAPALTTGKRARF